MPEPVQLAKAELRQLDADFKREILPRTWTKVQFNPETLKVSFANQVKTPEGAGDQSGPPARLFVGRGTTKLSLQLWFDVNAPLGDLPKEKDVRKLTKRVTYYITPQPQKGTKKLVPPAVRFLWGSFQFDGVLESLEESLEMFSPEGRPLRASMSLSLTRQAITHAFAAPRPGPAARAGSQQLAQAPSGGTVQQIAGDAGKPDDWQDIAAANNIENPRQLKPGQIIDLNAARPRS